MSDLKELYNCMDLSSEVRHFFNESQKNLTNFMNMTKELNIKEFDELVTIHKDRLIKLDELSYRLCDIHLTAVKLNEERTSRKEMEINYKDILEQLQKDYKIIEKELKQVDKKLYYYGNSDALNDDFTALNLIKRNIENSIVIVKSFIEEE